MAASGDALETTLWEYKVVTVNTMHIPELYEWLRETEDETPEIQKLLNSMGWDGWELVTFLPARPADRIYEDSATHCNHTIAANPWLYHAVFKKRIGPSEPSEDEIATERWKRQARGEG